MNKRSSFDGDRCPQLCYSSPTGLCRNASTPERVTGGLDRPPTDRAARTARKNKPRDFSDGCAFNTVKTHGAEWEFNDVVSKRAGSRPARISSVLRQVCGDHSACRDLSSVHIAFLQSDRGDGREAEQSRWRWRWWRPAAGYSRRRGTSSVSRRKGSSPGCERSAARAVACCTSSRSRARAAASHSPAARGESGARLRTPPRLKGAIRWAAPPIRPRSLRRCCRFALFAGVWQSDGNPRRAFRRF